MIPSLFNLFVKTIGPQTYGINASASLGNGFFYSSFWKWIVFKEYMDGINDTSLLEMDCFF